MDAAFKWLMLFLVTQILIIAVGSLPVNLWRAPRSMSANSLNILTS
jgi:hypothetical protein